MIENENKTSMTAVNFARNTGIHPLTLIDLKGQAHVFTPGLSLCSGVDLETLEVFSELVDEVDVLSTSSLKALSVASFKKLATGQVTIEALKCLAKADLKVGQLATVRDIAASEGIAV